VVNRGALNKMLTHHTLEMLKSADFDCIKVSTPDLCFAVISESPDDSIRLEITLAPHGLDLHSMSHAHRTLVSVHHVGDDAPQFMAREFRRSAFGHSQSSWAPVRKGQVERLAPDGASIMQIHQIPLGQGNATGCSCSHRSASVLDCIKDRTPGYCFTVFFRSSAVSS